MHYSLWLNHFNQSLLRLRTANLSEITHGDGSPLNTTNEMFEFFPNSIIKYNKAAYPSVPLQNI